MTPPRAIEEASGSSPMAATAGLGFPERQGAAVPSRSAAFAGRGLGEIQVVGVRAGK